MYWFTPEGVLTMPTKKMFCLALALFGLVNWPRPFSLRAGTVRESPPARYSRTPAEAARFAPTAMPENSLAEDDSVKRGKVSEAYMKRSPRFEVNAGQTDSRVKFVSRGHHSALFLTSTESVLMLEGTHPNLSTSKNSRQVALRTRLAGASATAEIEGLDQEQGKSNYFVGKDPGRWRTSIPSYGKVQYRSIYPGVDLVYYGKEQRIEYDFVVAPGADYGKIKLEIRGAKRLRIDDNGDLVLTTLVGTVRQRKPLVYQDIDGARREIAARYILDRNRQVRFELGKYDAGKPLVIDPVLDYSTFLGGSSSDEGHSIVVGADGSAYITGRTTSFNFPVTLSAFDTTYANSNDVFVTKLNPSGSALAYSTYLGGNSDDNGFGIVVDSTGNAYITGSTSSTDYPTTPGAFQATFRGGSFPGDGFVTKLNNTGSALMYSTFLGGTSSDQASAIAVDSSGNAYVTGFSISANFPTTPGAFQTTNAGGSFPIGDAFITKLNDAGTAVVYSTFLGGARADQGTGIVVDPLGRAFVSGATNSMDFDVTAGAFQTTFGGSPSTFSTMGDAFVTELNDTGTGLVYSTYVGGTQDDIARGVALNSSGEAFICGDTSSFNFPITPGVVRVANGGTAKSADGAVSWAAINAGLTGNTILSYAINPANTSIVYAGSSSAGIFRSTNAGANWSPINSGLTTLTIRALAIDPATPSTLYLGTDGRGVFRSTNSGDSWAGINTGQGGSSVNALAIDPSNPSVIYAGTNAGVFKTVNGGASWMATNTGLNSTFIHALAIDPVNTSTLYAGTFFGVFKTTNGGENWNITALNAGTFRALVVDPLAAAILYAGGDSGLFKSTDQGVTWRGSSFGLTNRTVNALAIDPATTSVLYAGTGNGIFKSTAGGAVWSATGSGLAGTGVNTLTVDPATPATIYAGVATGDTDGFITRLNATGATLIYSTYLGGSGFDSGASIVIDSADEAYVAGLTASPNFPTTPGAFQSASNFDSDAFVTKLNATGAGLVYSTHLGGFNSDQGFGIAVNASGNAYVTGTTSSSNFPTTPGAFQVNTNGFSGDAFVTKLDQAPTSNADLSITMTGPAGTLMGADNISYMITLTNNGPDPASSIVVTDELSPATTFGGCGSSVGSCNSIGSTVTFSLNSLASGASVNVTVFATVGCSIPPGGTQIVNTVTAESLTPDPNGSNNTKAVANSGVPGPAATLSPTNQPFPIAGGNSFVSVFSPNCLWSAISNVGWITVTFSSNCCNGIVQYTVAANPGPPRTGTMTIAANTFTVAQSGTALSSVSIGLHNPATSTFFLRNSNSTGVADLSFAYGPAGAGWIPLAGDWDGDGDDTIGLYNPTTSTFFLRNSNSTGATDLSFAYGPAAAGWIPIVGDWNNDGVDTIGLYNPATSTFFLRNSNSIGVADLSFAYGPGGLGWAPMAGDWNGDGTDTIGLYDPAAGGFFLRNSNSTGVADVTFSFGPGGLGWKPLVGDWNGDGADTVGLYNPATGGFFLRNSNSTGVADLAFSYGPGGLGWVPLTGNWDGL